MRHIFHILIVVFIGWSAPAFSVEPDEVLGDPALETRAREISAQLRCLVCQNQSIDDSDAPLAKDLRILVRERLTAGDSDKQVMQYLVDRYGEFVLLRPRFGLHTLVLWIAAPAMFLVGVFVLWRSVRRRRRLATNNIVELSGQELDDLADLLDREVDQADRKG